VFTNLNCENSFLGDEISVNLIPYSNENHRFDLVIVDARNLANCEHWAMHLPVLAQINQCKCTRTSWICL